MADTAAEFWHAVAGYLGLRLGLRVRVIEDVPWQARERLLLQGEAHLGVVCGLQYVYAQASSIELIAAPVMHGGRYRNLPIYFSDVVVRHDSQARSLADLRGVSWAVNEPTSQSGFNITRYVLAARGETSPFFGRVIESGAHVQSLALVLDGTVDGAAIDSTVLESLHWRHQVRVIETLGPSPIPPLVASPNVPRAVRDALQAALLGLADDPAATSLLQLGRVRRFVRVADADYEPIRRMVRVARRLPAWTLHAAGAVTAITPAEIRWPADVLPQGL
jgi:phosphonate transport system substrate-binding protein